MEILPFEMNVHIFQHLDLKDLEHVHLVNRNWQRILCSDHAKKVLMFDLIQEYRSQTTKNKLYLAIKYRYWRWILEITASENFKRWHEGLECASIFGYIPIVDYFKDKCSVWTSSFSLACKFGHIPLVEHFSSEKNKHLDATGVQKFSMNWQTAFADACQGGQKSVMIFF